MIHEVDAWRELSQWFSSTPGGALFAGDICTGGIRRRPIKSDLDVIRKIYKQDLTGVRQLSRALPHQQYTALEKAMSQGYSDILGRCPPTDAIWKKIAYLRVDQGERRFCAWRENFAGPFINVRSPILDKDVIEFMATVPRSLKRNSYLYKSTVKKMFPDPFKFKRATTSGFSEYTWERANLGVYHPEIEDFVANQDSLLDEFIPPDVFERTNRGVRAMVRKPRLKKVLSPIAKWGIRNWPGSLERDLRMRQPLFLAYALQIRVYLHKRLSTRSPVRPKVSA